MEIGTDQEIREQVSTKGGFTPADLNIEKAVRALQAPNTAASVAMFVLDWGLIFAAAIGSWWLFSSQGVNALSLAGYVAAVLIIGTRQKGIENLMHEGTHRGLSTNRGLNEFMAVRLGGMWLAPEWRPSIERRDHVGGHHGHFGDPAYDFEFYGYRELGLGKLPAATPVESFKILFMVFLKTTYWRVYHSARSFLPLPRLLGLVATLALLVWAGLLLPVILYWLVPFFALYMPMRYLAEVSEHMGLNPSSEFETTRNKLGWFQEYFMHPHGDGYHLVHHMYPGIPHQNLARAHRLLMQDPAYRSANHTYGLFLNFQGKRTTLGDLLVARS